MAIPLAVAWLKSKPSQRKWAYFAVGVLPFTISALNLDASLISWPAWSGYAKGLIITLLDSLALALVIVSRAPARRLPFLALLIAYLVAAGLSMGFSTVPMSTSFYVFQLMRVVILFMAVASFAGQTGALRWLAMGLATGAIFQVVVTIDQKFSGAAQAAGTMGHQNLLGLMLHCVTLPLLAFLLAGERRKIFMLGVLAALVAVAFGASRGAVGFVGIGMAILFFLSIVRKPTAHKWKMAGLAVLALAVVTPVVIASFGDRYELRPDSEGSNEERISFEAAAKAMWSDHPMGVGANQYILIANVSGYSERAGVIWNFESRSAPVHNMYLLIAAETGWPGLITFVMLIIWSILRGLAFAFGNRTDPRGEIVLGASVAILVLALHGLYEWVFVTFYAQYVFAISLGIIAGIIRQVEREKMTRKQPPRRSARQGAAQPVRDDRSAPAAEGISAAG
ncbi:O-antigen ligase family protein [Sphingopyxis sp.]|uniref:O-antigen ligase family protein n=1 Tax=Sphingopyxis sp. TaxID=1908224 RepID=UPI001E00B4E0|nr:O-antigen ligase family protein [Sphingopyxis sp.]MBW8295320.1 O-antigen ligase family protein [Sphingopyxis sp.]MBW8295337.1 O-antigen ligase family protein [Sphingopyxis sp.]